jgi:hypothetical protein
VTVFNDPASGSSRCAWPGHEPRAGLPGRPRGIEFEARTGSRRTGVAARATARWCLILAQRSIIISHSSSSAVNDFRGQGPPSPGRRKEAGHGGNLSGFHAEPSMEANLVGRGRHTPTECQPTCRSRTVREQPCRPRP